MVESSDNKEESHGLRKIPDNLRMAMSAAVELGLSEHQTGKLFGIPSVTRVLKELRNSQRNDLAHRLLLSDEDRAILDQKDR